MLPVEVDQVLNQAQELVLSKNNMLRNIKGGLSGLIQFLTIESH